MAKRRGRCIVLAGATTLGIVFSMPAVANPTGSVREAFQPANAAAPAPPSPSAAMFTRIDPPAQPEGAIPLYAGPAPGSETSQAKEVWDRMPDGQPVLRNVTRPTLTPFLPRPGAATGAAMIVVPGGGFNILALRNEGWAVAQWLADHGIAAFVLKYRIMETPAEEKDLLPALMRGMRTLMSGPEKDRLPAYAPATADAQQAVRMIRADAARWRIDQARIGMIGFSAGALTTIETALSPDPEGRPDYIGYIYGPMVAREVPATAPPLFAALAMDDPLFGGEGFGIAESWRKAKRPVELHVYEKGGHGFAAGSPDTTSTMLLPGFLAWLNARGIVKAK